MDLLLYGRYERIRAKKGLLIGIGYQIKLEFHKYFGTRKNSSIGYNGAGRELVFYFKMNQWIYAGINHTQKFYQGTSFNPK